jgi:nucleoid-associated protein YgaU
VRTRAYLQDKERVDQEIPGLEETVPAKTRKIVVVEFVQKEKPLEDTVVTKETKTVEATDQSRIVTESTETVVVHQDNFTFPKMTSETLTNPPAPVTVTDGSALPAQYTVQKDDTLQKISKKFYGSYSKWTRIYNANQERIKDPNFLKPGVTLTIPALEATVAESK